MTTIEPFRATITSQKPLRIGLDGVQDQEGIRSYSPIVVKLINIPIVRTIARLLGVEVINAKDVLGRTYHLSKKSLADFLERHSEDFYHDCKIKGQMGRLSSTALLSCVAEVSKKHCRKEIVELADEKNKLSLLQTLAKHRDARPLVDGKRNWSIAEEHYDDEISTLVRKVTQLEEKIQ
jgi:hypothetical protein